MTSEQRRPNNDVDNVRNPTVNVRFPHGKRTAKPADNALDSARSARAEAMMGSCVTEWSELP